MSLVLLVVLIIVIVFVTLPNRTGYRIPTEFESRIVDEKRNAFERDNQNLDMEREVRKKCYDPTTERNEIDPEVDRILREIGITGRYFLPGPNDTYRHRGSYTAGDHKTFLIMMNRGWIFSKYYRGYFYLRIRSDIQSERREAENEHRKLIAWIMKKLEEQGTTEPMVFFYYDYSGDMTAFYDDYVPFSCVEVSWKIVKNNPKLVHVTPELIKSIQDREDKKYVKQQRK